MFETIVNAGTALYNAMISVFNALMYVADGKAGFYSLIANGEFNVNLIQLMLGALSTTGIGYLFALIKRFSFPGTGS